MNALKSKAIELREAGFSYSMIRDQLKVSKSTLSNWLCHVPYTPNQHVVKRVGKAKLKSALFKQRMKFRMFEEVKKQAIKDIIFFSKRDLFFFGLGIYFGEGDKSFEHVRIVNSNPHIIQIAIRWFRDICGATVENFRPTIHLYPDNNVKEALQYWSGIAGVPIERFSKSIIDTRTNKLKIKHRKLPHGTLHLLINSNGIPSLGVRLHRTIMAWIERTLHFIAPARG